MSGTQGSAPGTYVITLVPPVRSITPGLPGCVSGPFAGMLPGALQVALSQAQQALIALETGSQPITVDYAEGQGRRSVTYSRANSAGLRQLIRDLKAALGYRVGGAIGMRVG